MARAFRRMVELGAQGWELHLVGGCAPRYRDYAMAVRRELQGLPAEVHFNASGEELAELLAEASVVWHVGGMGEDLEAHPDRAEHFGIAVVEAMSAGAVPVVFAEGGPAAVVRPGREGCHVRTEDELATVTLHLVRDPATLGRMATAARQRAQDFRRERFDEALLRLVEELPRR